MIRGMGYNIFNAAEDGNTDDLLTHAQGSLSSIRTPAGDTIIQVHVRVKERSANIGFLETVIEREPSLLSARNDAEEIPLHTASRSGQHGAVKLFLERGGGSYAAVINKKGDTALHIASREGFILVVKELLCGNHMVDQNYKYTANHTGETPLYLAVEYKHHEIIDLLIAKIPASQHGHPSIGCALHAAVSLEHLGIVDKIMDLDPALIRFQDSKGQTPLHYAALNCWPEGTELLLRRDPLAVYCQDKKGQTAAHVAAERNYVTGLQLFVKLNPDCCEALDNNGQNVAHRAADRGNGEVFRYFLEDGKFRNLIYQEDIHGNTPFHLFADSIPRLPHASVTSMHRNKVISFIQKFMKPIFDKENRTPGDVAAKHTHTLSHLEPSAQDLLRKFVAVAPTSSRNKDLQEHILRSNVVAEEERKRVASRVLKAVKVFMPLSILLAGISYQAGISVPGGFNQNDSDRINGGTSMLVSKSSFQAFIALNSISFMASIIEAILYTMVWVNNGVGIWKTVFTWTSRLTLISVGLLVTAYAVNLYSTTWKSEFCMIIVNLLLAFFMLVYGGFVAWALRYTRVKSKLVNMLV